MNLARLHLAAFAILSLVTAASALGASDAPIGIAAFTSHSRFVDAQISPKGTYLAAVSVEGGKRALKVVDLKARKLVSAFKPERASVGGFQWVNDSRIAIELYDEEDLLASPVNRGEIYAIDATGANGSMIYGYRAGIDSGILTGRERKRERVHGYATIIGG